MDASQCSKYTGCDRTLCDLMQENANLEDIVRFFHGFELMGNPVTVLKRVSSLLLYSLVLSLVQHHWSFMAGI